VNKKKTNPEYVKSFNEDIMALVHDLRGDDQATGDLCKPNSMFIKDETDWMQGVLHFYSTTLHAMALLQLDKFMVAEFNKLVAKSKYSEAISPMVRLLQCSSDDSRMRLGCGVDPNFEGAQRFAMHCILQVGSMKRVQYNLWSASESRKKSTQFCATGFTELKSRYGLLCNTLLPLIKPIYTSVIPTASVTTKTTQLDNLKSANRALREYGASAFLCEVAQFAQRDAYWEFQGSKSASLFDDYALNLRRMPHSSLGLYLMDPPGTVGLFPEKFSEYFYMRNWDLYSRVTNTLLNIGVLETDANGDRGISIKINIGKGDKLKKIKERMGHSDEYIDYYYEHPSSLYREPTTIKEARMWAFNQLSKPSLEDSLHFKSPVKGYVFGMLMHANAVSSIRRLDKTEFKRMRISFLKLMDLDREDGLKIAVTGLTEDLIRFFCPNYPVYDIALEVARFWMNGSVSGRSKPKICRQIVVNMPRLSRSAPMNFADFFRAKYWKFHEGYSATEVTRSFLIYREMFPWLKDNYQDTIKASPFAYLGEPDQAGNPRHNHIGLADFVRGVEKGSGSVSYVGPFRQITNYRKTFEVLMVFMDQSGRRLWKNEAMQRPLRAEKTEILTNISLLLTSPSKSENTRADVNEEIINIIKAQPSIWDRNVDPTYTQFSSLGKAEKNLALIQIYLKEFYKQYETILVQSPDPNDPPTEERKLKTGFIDLMRTVKMGELGFFVSAQRQQGPYWTGEGTYQLELEGSIYTLSLVQQHISKVQVLDAVPPIAVSESYFVRKMQPLFDFWPRLVKQLKIDLNQQFSQSYGNTFADIYVNLSTKKTSNASQLGMVPVIFTDFIPFFPDEALLSPLVSSVDGTITIRNKQLGNVLKLKRSWSSQQKSWATELFEKNNSVEILKFNATNFFLDLKAVNQPIRVPGAKYGNIWMEVGSASLEDLRALLSRYNKKKFQNTSNNVRYWIKRTLLSRYAYRFNVYEESNYLLTKKSRPLQEVEDDEDREFENRVGGDRVTELTELMLEESNLFSLEGPDEDFAEVGVSEEAGVSMFLMDAEGVEDDWEAVAQENTEAKTYLREMTIDKLHPFWDELIDHLRTVDQYNLHRTLASGTRFRQTEVAAQELLDLYDIMEVQERPEDTLSVSGTHTERQDYDDIEQEFENY